MPLVPETLPRALSGALAPAWLVAGDEPLLVGEAADLIRARARQAGYSGREVQFTDRHTDWDPILGGVRSLSLFAERRILELRMASAKPGTEGSKALVAMLSDPSPDVLLLVIAGKIEYADRSSAWVKAFEAHGQWVDAEQLQPEQLPAWLAARLRRHGLEPEPEAVQLLAERCEGNLVAAHQEIELLALLAGKGPLSAETVSESVANSARYEVGQLGEAMLAGDAGRLVRILDGLEADGEGLPLVLWWIAEELRAVLQYPGPAGGYLPRMNRGGRRRKEFLARAARRVPRPVALDLLVAATRADAMVKGARKDEAWGELRRIATEFCIAPRPRAV